MVSPTSIYSNAPPPPYSSGWHSNQASGLISPPESRRTSDKADPPHPIQTTQIRQSLPSIHEALSSGPKTNPYASPVSASLPHSQVQLPFSTQAPSISRSFPPESAPYPASSLPRQPSPLHAIHSQSNGFSRPGPVPAPFENKRNGLNSQQNVPGPHNPFASRPYETSRYEEEQRAVTNGYGHHPSAPQQQSAYQFGSGSAVPYSQPGKPNFSEPRYQQPRTGKEQIGQRDDGKAKDIPFAQSLKRSLDVFGISNDLQLVSTFLKVDFRAEADFGFVDE
jgi:hypothetical protein